MRVGLGAVALSLLATAPTSAPKSAPGAAPPKRVMAWMAGPGPRGTSFDEAVADLRRHRGGFTAISFMFHGICGAGSDDAGGSMDCAKQDAAGAPHLARAHPPTVAPALPAQLARAFPGKELWPMIAYGNPGNASHGRGRVI